MPSRNVIKVDIPQSYYHVYARGHGRKNIFRDDSDFQMFLSLFERHLSIEQKRDKYGNLYPHLRKKISLLCYCLMNNHFHLLVYQENEGAMSRLMKGIMTSYSMYFNKRYKSSGPLFETRYKASRISSDAYLMHISRYIHLNAKDWQSYPYSSIHSYFVGPPEWLHPEPIIKLFGTLPKYADFIDDYVSYKNSIKDIGHELADSI